jgi:hypothetical protein
MMNTNNTTIMEEIFMKLSKNVGELDSLLRISLGFSILGYGIAKKSSFPILLGSWKIAEGITGHCVMYHLFGINTLNNEFNFSKGKGFMLHPIGVGVKEDDLE